jgi:hypothetical protein
MLPIFWSREAGDNLSVLNCLLARLSPLVCDRYHSQSTPLAGLNNFASVAPRSQRTRRTGGSAILCRARGRAGFRGRTADKSGPRNKPRNGSVSLAETFEPERQSGDVRGAPSGFVGAGAARASGRYEEVHNPCGTCLRGIACRRAIGDAERSSAIVNSRRQNGIDASADNRRVLH